jgi:hypothetical protein
VAGRHRNRGYDAASAAGHPDWEALPEPEVLALARAERRVIVTNNVRDFRPLHVEAVMPGGPGRHGMIVGEVPCGTGSTLAISHRSWRVSGSPSRGGPAAVLWFRS